MHKEEQANPSKDYLFEYLSQSEEKIKKLVSEQKFSEIIDLAISDCYDKILTMGEKHNVIGVFATGLLHFLLTNALITSQRKVQCQDLEVDIVIPDLKTLEKDAKKTLIICIPKTDDRNTILQKLEDLNKIQQEKNNIWLVLSEDLGFDKSYVLDKTKNSTFSKIIFDIAQFVNVQGQNKFKILRI